MSGEKTFSFLKFEGQSGVQTRDLRLSKQAALTTAPRPPHTKKCDITRDKYIIEEIPVIIIDDRYGHYVFFSVLDERAH